jgi:intron-binding protein aquarius
MEEAAQILEVESFIPLLLQSPDCDDVDIGPVSRLKRVVLIGDHHQLPPIVQNSAFQIYANMEQSMFTRLVRLGVPTVELDRQGRCRQSLSQLFKWNYPGLGDLDGVSQGEFLNGNPGFKWEYQLVDVPDYGGKGEMEPAPHYLQNLGEAEYVVGVFMYMRLRG